MAVTSTAPFVGNSAISSMTREFKIDNIGVGRDIRYRASVAIVSLARVFNTRIKP